MNIVSSWSGGKDSCFALMQSIQSGCKPKVLLNMMNENGKVSRSHAIPESILLEQAKAMQLPIKTVATSWTDYEQFFIKSLHELKEDYSLDAAVFGDIDLQAHRDWEERVCNSVGIKALLPLWQQNRKQLVLQMLNSGIKSFIVSCNTTMGFKFLGQQITKELVDELEAIGVDTCGENGEYHTLVTDSKLFKNPIGVSFGEKKQHENYCFIEMR